MKSTLVRFALGIALAGGICASSVRAENGTKTLPTLLIKGEVVSVDANDPSATLLKVKDRYGFETPIFVTPETKISQGEAAQTIASLAAGTPVEVEYNFDINTAKRHAVSVKVVAQAPAAPSAAPAAEAPAAPASPMVSAPAAAPASPESAAAAQPAAPAAPAAATPAPAASPAIPEQQ